MGPRLKDVEDDGGCDDGDGFDHASMGPRLKDVEDMTSESKVPESSSLQWGHVSRTWKTCKIQTSELPT